MPVTIFFCYARKDQALLNDLKAHLQPLQRQGLIEIWDDGEIPAGTEWEQEISKHLNAAQIILLLVSPSFMNSDYCYGIEMKRAIERHERKEARVIPVILDYVYWQIDPLNKLQALPTDGKPVMSAIWHSLNEAFFNVTEGIRQVVEEISNQPEQQQPSPIKQIKEIAPDSMIEKATNDHNKSSDSQAIKDQFHQAMINTYKEAAKKGYRATQFLRMVNEKGGVEAAHFLLAKESTEGFTKLWDMGRLDLSVEALVLKPQFVSLFDEMERDKARKRLAEYKYRAPWDSH